MTLPLSAKHGSNNQFPAGSNPSVVVAENVCDLRYLTELMGGKTHLIMGIMNAFLKQVPEELFYIVNAIRQLDFDSIKKYAHTMKSSVSVVGISSLVPILQEMETLGEMSANIDRIKELNNQLNSLCQRAIAEIETEKIKYENK